MSTSAKGKMSAYSAEEVLAKLRSKTQTAATPEAKQETASKESVNIQENPFYKIMFEPNKSPAEKKEAYEKALAYDKTKSKAENAAMHELSEQLKDWLNVKRKEIIKELIRLSDTKAYAEMQTVIEEMNQSMLDFEQLVGPMVETIDAIHKLNVESGGQMYEVFKEIKEDKAELERIAAEKQKLQDEANTLEQQQLRLRSERSTLLEDKPWYKFGKVRESSLSEANYKSEQLSTIDAQIAELKDKALNLKPERESKFAHLANEKAELAKLLDLTSEANKGRQEQLVKAAFNHVETMDEKTGSVLDLMKAIGKQLERSDDTNGKMQRAFMIIKEAEVGAMDTDVKLKDEFTKAADGESDLQKLERETTRDSINDHVTVLADSSKVTLKTAMDLGEESVRIKSMKDNNRQQASTTKEMNTRGTATVAGSLLSTLTSFSAAALNEAKSTITNTMKTMDATTREIMEREVIQSAVGKHVENNELSQMIEKMEKTKAVGMEQIEIARSAIETRRKLKVDMERITKQLADVVQESQGLEAESLEGGEPEGIKPAPEQDNRKPAPAKPAAGPALDGLNI